MSLSGSVRAVSRRLAAPTVVTSAARRGVSHHATAPLAKKAMATAQEKLRGLTSDWAEAWSELVQWEQAADTAAAQERVRHWGDKRLKAEGHMLDGLSGNGVAVDTVSFELRGQAHAALSEHRFATGDTVTVCRGNPAHDRWVEGRDRLDGLIVKITPFAIHVKFGGDDLARELFTGEWRLDRGTNGVSAQRQCVALSSFVNATSPDTPCDMWLKAILLDDADMMAGLRVDAAKLARAEPQGITTAYRRNKAGELTTDSDTVAALLEEARLNESQRNAVT